MSLTKIKSYLFNNGISQKQFYNIVKRDNDTPLTYNNINAIVNGRKKSYTIQTLFKICRALNCTPNDILDYESYAESPRTYFSDDGDGKESFVFQKPTKAYYSEREDEDLQVEAYNENAIAENQTGEDDGFGF